MLIVLPILDTRDDDYQQISWSAYDFTDDAPAEFISLVAYTARHRFSAVP